ncbi:MAG TPA: Uma2 family endonuclease [Pirellulales bacterium]|nr:Uma2 family endonuclease [Pirellulales bacterium]
MSLVPPISPATPGPRDVVYPSSDGRPVAETPIHRKNLLGTIDVLEEWFDAESQVYVSGNMFIYYVEGDKWKHVSPDVFVVRGIPKDKPRDYYLVWEERAVPDLVIEMTSKSTCDEDVDWKLPLYRDVLKVREYFLFDPHREYLEPPLQGYRLRAGTYERVSALAGRLPSEVLGLHLEADGDELRLYDPRGSRWLPTSKEERARAKTERKRADEQQARAEAERKRAEAERRRADEQQAGAEAERKRAEAERKRADEQQARAEAERKRAWESQIEIDRLRSELEALRRRPSGE